MPLSAGAALTILAAAAAWGSTGTAAHFAPKGATSASIGAARLALGGALLLIAALRTSASRQGVRELVTAGASRRPAVDRAVLVLAAAAVAGYQVCFFTAVRETGVAIGTVVAIGSAPGWTGLLTVLTGGPRPGRRWSLATAAAVAGCVVLVTGGRAGGASPAGVALALAAGLCYAVYAVAAGRLIAAGSPEPAVMGLLFGAAAAALVPVLAVSDAGWVFSVRGAAVVCYLGVVTTLVAYLLYGRGLRTVSAPVAVTLGLAEPGVAAVLGLLVLHERLAGSSIAGLVLIGLALAGLVARRPALVPSVRAGPPE